MTQRLSKDSEGLHFWGDETQRIGYVPEVNGHDAAEIPNFVPTRYELIQLVKFWATLQVDQEFFFFLYRQTGSSEWRLRQFAHRRICRIATVLGKEEVRKAVETAEDEFGKSVDFQAWRIFTKGTGEEQKAFQDEVQRSISEDCQDSSGEHDRR